MRWWQGIRLDQGTNRTGTQSFSLFPEVSAVCWLGTTPPFAWNIQRFRVPFRPELSNPRLQSLSTGHAIWWKTVSNFSTFPAVPNVQISFSEDKNAMQLDGMACGSWGGVRKQPQNSDGLILCPSVSLSVTLLELYFFLCPCGINLGNSPGLTRVWRGWIRNQRHCRVTKQLPYVQYNYPPVPRMTVYLSAKE